MHGPCFHGAEECRKLLVERLGPEQEGRVSTLRDVVRSAGPLLELELEKKIVVEEGIVGAVEDRERCAPLPQEPHLPWPVNDLQLSERVSTCATVRSTNRAMEVEGVRRLRPVVEVAKARFSVGDRKVLLARTK